MAKVGREDKANGAAAFACAFTNEKCLVVWPKTKRTRLDNQKRTTHMKTFIVAFLVIFVRGFSPEKTIDPVDLTYKWDITWFGYTSFLREIERFPKAEKEAYQKKMKKSFVRFKQNGSYTMRFIKTKDEGTWEIKNKQLLLNSSQGAKVEFTITPLSKTKLRLYQVQKKDTLFMMLER